MHRYLADLPPASLEVAPLDLEKRVASERTGERKANIHLRVDGRFDQRYALLFRDYLRKHVFAARAYGDAKRALAAIVGHDADTHDAVKQPVFDILIGSAFDWAERTDWEPGPPDA
ncbi:MAG TPA: GrpB family protein [Acidimicrobiia bacterium]|nr:GrpB family protein [Acidimicrobiia bacterium]